MRGETVIHPGQAARRGTYQCADCGYELRTQGISSMPPCPRSSNAEHEANTWHRRRGGVGLGLAVATGGLALGAGLLVYAVGTRRIAAEARQLADQVADQGRQLAAEGRHAAARGARRSRRLARAWFP